MKGIFLVLQFIDQARNMAKHSASKSIIVRIIFMIVVTSTISKLSKMGALSCEMTEKKDGPTEEVINPDFKITYFHAPDTGDFGGTALLTCFYNLGSELLYAVKWYKDMQEFYRYVPLEQPPVKFFKQPGVSMDLTNSNITHVILDNLQWDSPGNYTCQLSSDGPYFHCVQRTKYIHVVVFPSEAPELLIEDEKEEFQIGDNISTSCTFGRGKPAPKLTWYINGNPVLMNYTQDLMIYPDDTKSTSTSLQFFLEPDHVKDGKVILQCIASTYTLQNVATKTLRAGTIKNESILFVVLLTPLTVFFPQHLSIA